MSRERPGGRERGAPAAAPEPRRGRQLGLSGAGAAPFGAFGTVLPGPHRGAGRLSPTAPAITADLKEITR